jgi:1,4-alpha-glucan branching enzyme
VGWGYGDTHHFVIESSSGGRDKYKHFVRECHRRGIAVIQDVVYNHYDSHAARVEWEYDSAVPEENIYYWYEGRSADYPRPDGGYLNNGSSGYTPRFWEETVRQLFISSAAELVEEFHVDGLRVDLTQAMHRDNSLNANRWSIRNANLFGQKCLREWSRTLRMIRPTVMLIAEDHTGWDAVTKVPTVGGLGFDATWLAELYHHLIGDADAAGGAARLIRDAGFGSDGPLAMAAFSGRLWRSQFSTVVYHESHDEAGNARGSRRTAKVAVNDAPLIGTTRDFAEARCRVAAGLAILSAGTPMFLMGEEIVAQRLYKYDTIVQSKEDLHGERAGTGARMFRFYQDLIRLRRANPVVRSHHIDIVHVADDNRVIAFTRRQGSNELLIVASLNNQPFANRYVIQTDPHRLPDGAWRETFNSDGAIYGGGNVGNRGMAMPASHGRIEVRIPANGFLVFQRL